MPEGKYDLPSGRNVKEILQKLHFVLVAGRGPLYIAETLKMINS